MKRVYLVRHCKAKGQEPEAQLTDEGERQAERLAEYLSDKNINYIVSSPFERAMATIRPFSVKTSKKIHVDRRLSERVLSVENLPDWMEKLKETFSDLDLKLPGGESSREAMSRGVEVIEELFHRNEDHIVVVTHGNLMSLILKYFDDRIGFEEWRGLSNPDIYELSQPDESCAVQLKRL